ncbi:MAG: PQQ-binding-like beta-propeller repeat protein [Planctomycetota bacterium]|jgi:outer membrane protein assembly factor BamB
MTQALRQELTDLLDGYRQNLASSEFLFRRGEELERLGRVGDALTAYNLASNANGERYRALARERLTTAEANLSSELVRQIITATEQGDAAGTFDVLDNLAITVERALTNAPGEHWRSLSLPLTITLSNVDEQLEVTVDDDAPQQFSAPATNSGGAWHTTIRYPVDGSVTVTVQRRGHHTFSQRFSRADRLLAIKPQLERGPSWTINLGDRPTTTIVCSGRQALVTTSDSRIHFIDVTTGHKASVAHDPVHNFNAAPLMLDGTAYVAIGGQIHAADLATHSRLWSFPPATDLDAPSLGSQGMWVQEHDLIPGQHQIFTSAQDPGDFEANQLMTLAVAGGEIAVYPASKLPGPPSAPMMACDGLLFVPCGKLLVAYDTTASGPQSAPREVFRVSTSGTIHQRPLAANVGGIPAVLLTDDRGAVVAIDRRLDRPSERRVLTAWTFDSGSCTIAADGDEAYVLDLSTGTVAALDLSGTNTGLRWQSAPERGPHHALGPIALTTSGVHLVDPAGSLISLSRHDGHRLWLAKLGGQPVAGVTGSGDSLLIPLNDGRVVCFDSGSSK